LALRLLATSTRIELPLPQAGAASGPDIQLSGVFQQIIALAYELKRKGSLSLRPKGLERGDTSVLAWFADVP